MFFCTFSSTASTRGSAPAAGGVDWPRSHEAEPKRHRFRVAVCHKIPRRGATDHERLREQQASLERRVCEQPEEHRLEPELRTVDHSVRVFERHVPVLLGDRDLSLLESV